MTEQRGEVSVAMQEVVSLIQKEQVKLKAFIARKVDSGPDIDDIYQEVLTRIISKDNAGEIRRPVHYAFRVADNLISDHYRSKHTQAETVQEEVASPGPLPEEILINRQRCDLIKEVIINMPPVRREVFIRRRVQGESCKSIALGLGISVKAVEKHISKALVSVNRVRREMYREREQS